MKRNPHLLAKAFFTACLALGATLPLSAQEAEPRMLSLEALQADYAILHEALTTMHPGLNRYESTATVEGHFLALESSLTAPLTEGEWHKRVAQLMHKIGCQHSYVNPYNMKREIRERLLGGETCLPFYFRLIEGRMVVTHNASNRESFGPGSEITAINGVPIVDIVASMTTAMRGDGTNPGYWTNQLEVRGQDKYEAFDLYYPLFYPITTSELTIEGLENGMAVTFTTPRLSRMARTATITERYGPMPGKEERWNYRVLPNGVGVMQVGDWAIWDTNIDHKAFFKEAFATFEASGVSSLIVDLRGNGGGLTEPMVNFASWVIPKPITIARTECQAFVAVPDHLKAYLDTYDRSLYSMNPSKYEQGEGGMYYQKGKSKISLTLKPKKDHFTGNLYLLCDTRNASATFQLLSNLQDHGVGTLVGQPTGGNKRGINGNNYFFMYLPNTGLEIDIPIERITPNYARLEAKNEGVQPHHVVYPTVAGIREGKDEVLEYTLALIDGQAKK